MDLKTRLSNKAIITSNNCWQWTASVNHKGYGSVGIRNNWTGLAHRLSWEVNNGEIPTGLQVCHKCDNPGCINPEHLFLGTNRDNQLDSLAKGRAWAGKHELMKQLCPKGHPYSGDNLVLTSKGHRLCLTCKLNRK